MGKGDCVKQICFSFLILGFISFSLSCGRPAPQAPKEKINLTLEELEYYNGQSGRPTYVAIDGDIYDISKCRYWKNGEHARSNSQAFAGRDLTDVLNRSKHGTEKLKRYPIIGRLIEKAKE